MPEYFAFRSAAALSTYFGFAPSSSGYETVTVPESVAGLPVPVDVAAGGVPHATTTPVAAIACKNARRERTGVLRSSIEPPRRARGRAGAFSHHTRDAHPIIRRHALGLGQGRRRRAPGTGRQSAAWDFGVGRAALRL